MRRRVALIGRTALAVECLDVVRRAGDDIVAVIPDVADDGTDGWQPSLRGAATRAGDPILDAPNVNDPAFVDRLDALRPDFLLSFQAAPILRGPLIATAGIAALNLHYGPLPRYRGVSPIAWALVNGEAAHGVTLHHIDTGIDSGPLVAARSVDIAPEDTGRSLYDRCVTAGIALFAERWPEVRTQDPVPATPQDPTAALYYNRWAMDFSDRRVRWDADAATVANRTRAFIFPPFQHPEVGTPSGAVHAIGSVRWDRRAHRGRPGEVLEVGDDGTVVVGAPGGRVLLSDLAADGARATGEHLEAAGIVPGAILS